MVDLRTLLDFGNTIVDAFFFPTNSQNCFYNFTVIFDLHPRTPLSPLTLPTPVYIFAFTSSALPFACPIISLAFPFASPVN